MCRAGGIVSPAPATPLAAPRLDLRLIPLGRAVGPFLSRNAPLDLVSDGRKSPTSSTAHAARTRCGGTDDHPSVMTTRRKNSTASGPLSRVKRSVSSAAAVSWLCAADRPAAIAASATTW
jgi:hypothetical protein